MATINKYVQEEAISRVNIVTVSRYFSVLKAVVTRF